MKILLAEDDTFFQKILQQVLAPDHEITLAADGLEAWEKLQRPEAPRLAILDWVMPGLSGPQICRKVRANVLLSSMYLIILTAKNNEADIVSGLRAGADDYITKPPIPAELRARVRAGERILTLQDVLQAQSILPDHAVERENILPESRGDGPTDHGLPDREQFREKEISLRQHHDPEECCSLPAPKLDRHVPYFVAKSERKYHPHD